MSDENATLEQPASTEVEQPAEPQAVESGAHEEAQAPAEPAAETPAPRLYAGKYKSVEELEAAYQNTTSEATRMAQRLAETAPKKEEAKYTPDQLESWKEGRILEVAQANSAAQRAYSEGKYAEAQQFEAQARESAKQIRLIDAELRKMDIQNSLKGVTKQSAEAKLVTNARGVLQQYQADLVPGTELYSKASEFMMDYEAMGMDVTSPLVQAQAVSMAAQLLGLGSKTAVQTARKDLTKNITQALKQGVIQGAGKAAKTASTAPDFMKMSDAEFLAYKRQRGWD